VLVGAVEVSGTSVLLSNGYDIRQSIDVTKVIPLKKRVLLGRRRPSAVGRRSFAHEREKPVKGRDLLANLHLLMVPLIVAGWLTHGTVGGAAWKSGSSLQAFALQQSSGTSNALSAQERQEGWTLLFDGRALTGWTPVGKADWQVQDGSITFVTGQGMLVTDRPFGNFELSLEFMGEKTANSGVFIRCPAVGAGTVSQTTCYEINIFDPHETAPTGSIVGVHSVLPDRPDTAGKWNTYQIVARGAHLTVKLNGKTTVDMDETKMNLVNGTIALQAGGPGGPGRISFRSIKIRSL
jgi:hypothetical protein